MTKLKGLNVLRKAIENKKGLSPSSNNPLIDNLRNGNVNYENQFYKPEDERGGSVDDSMFLTGMENPHTTRVDGGIDEIKSYRQPWISKAAAGVGRVGSKVAAEVSKMPGVIGGIIGGTAGQIADLTTGEDNTDFMQAAFNNGWIKSVNAINEHINEEFLPVHVSKAVKEGNLWENITSVDFWATEGADGLGYIISMLAPGAAINRMKLGSKIFQGLSEYNMLGSKVDDAIQTLSKYGVTPKNVDVHTATLANTLFEAGAEAQGAMEGYTQSLKQRLESGEIDLDDYNRLNEKASTVGRNVFLANAAILIGPNAMMSKMIWGGATNKVRNSFRTAEGKLAKQAATKLDKVGSTVKDIGAGVLREGFFEEGMQSTAETYFTENPDKSFSDFALGDFAHSYADMLQTTEGQKAIFLGAVFGGGMVGIGNQRKRNADEAEFNRLVNIANDNITNFRKVFNEDIYERNEDGTIKYEVNEKTGESQPVYDKIKIKEKIEGLDAVEKESLQYDAAVERGDVETMKLIRDNASTGLILPFIFNENLGLEVLEQHLRESSEAVKMAENEGVETEDIISETMEKARRMKANYKAFNEFAPSIVKIKDKDASKEDIRKFYQELAMDYLHHKEIKARVDGLISLKNKNLDEVLEDRGTTREKFDRDKTHKVANQLKDDRVQFLTDHLDYLEKKKVQLEEKDEEYWNSEKINERFSARLKEKKALEKKVDEESDKVETTLDNIEKAKTTDEVDAASQGQDTEDKKRLAEEKAAVKSIVDKVNANPSMDNLKNALSDLNNLNISTHSISKVLSSIEKRIADKVKAQQEFAKYLAELEQTLTEGMKASQTKIEALEEKIALHKRRRNKIKRDLDKEDKNPKGRNAKIIKDLIKETESELAKVDSLIEDLTKQKEKLEKEALSLDKQLGDIAKSSEYIMRRFEQIEQQDFSSVEDVINYIKENRKYFGDHRYDIERLLTHKFYTEQNIEALEDVIDSLENYRDVLVSTLNKYREEKGDGHEDTQFLRKQLLATEKELFEARKEFKEESEKVKRLSKAIIDKQVLAELAPELAFWENLQNTKLKNKPSLAFDNPVINLAAIDKKQKLAEEKKRKAEAKKEQAKRAKELSEELADAKEEGILDARYYYDYVVNNMAVGEQIPNPPKDFGVPAAITKRSGGYFLKKVTDNSITIEKDGASFTKHRDSLISKDVKGDTKKDVSTPLHNTEGGVTDRIIEEGENLPKDKDGNVIEQTLSVINNDARAITGTDKNANLDFISSEMISYERAPRNKKGDSVSFELNKEYTKGKQGKALKLLDKKELTSKDIEFLINHLPINVVFGENAKAPLETYNENKDLSQDERDSYNKVFDKTSKDLRTAIIKEVILNSTNISDITTTISGQKPGSIQVAPKVNDKVVENNIADLYEFGGEAKNIKTEDIYVVNDNGTLQNYRDKFYDLGRRGAPGEVYVMIHTANGTPFPLKLNIKKVQQNEAELLYEVYKHRFEVGIDKGKAQPIVETNDTIKKLVQTVFEEELAEGGLFTTNKKKLEDLTIKDVVDFLIWDGTKSRKSQVRLQNGHLKVMDATYDKEKFLKSKDTIIKQLTDNKRRNIFFKRKGDEDSNSLNFNNRTYVDYLIKNKILNTNALANEDFPPTFQGDTTIYLKTNNVKVKTGPDAKLSNFNVSKKTTYKDNIRGTKASLRRTEKGLFLKELALVGEEFYQEKGKPNSTKYQRVTHVTADSKQDLSAARYYNAAKRGDVVDALLRDFFSVGYKSEEAFIEDANKKLDQVNKDRSKHSDIFISENAFKELYVIAQEYEIEFQRRGYTIYSTTNPLYGKLRKNNKPVDVAGSMDLLAKDKLGRYIIIDIKTSTLDRAQDYKKGAEKSYYLEKDRKQQNAYAELFKQRTRKDVSKILILPITATASKEEGETNSVYRNFTRTKEESAFIDVDMRESIFDIMGEKPLTSQDTSIPGKTKSKYKGPGKFNMEGITQDTPVIPEGEVAAEDADLTFQEDGDGMSAIDAMYNELFGDKDLKDFVKDRKEGKKMTSPKKSTPKKTTGKKKPSTSVGVGATVGDKQYIVWGNRRVVDKETGKEISDEKLINYLEVTTKKISHDILDLEGDKFAVTSDGRIIDMTDYDRGAEIDPEDDMGKSILRRMEFKKSGKSASDILKSQKKSVSLQKGEEMIESNIDKLSEEEANKYVKQFARLRSLPSAISRDIRGIIKKQVTSQEKLKEIVELVTDKAAANEDVKTICKNI